MALKRANCNLMALKYLVVRKNSLATGGFTLRPPSVIRLSYTRWLDASPNLDIYTFLGGLILLPKSKILVKCQHTGRGF